LVLLIGQALLNGSCDHTVNVIHAVLPTLFGMLLAQPDLGIACLQSVKRPAMSVAVETHAHFTLFRTHADLAVHACKKGNDKIAVESAIYLKHKYSL